MQVVHPDNRPRVGSNRDWRHLKQFAGLVGTLDLPVGWEEKKERGDLWGFCPDLKYGSWTHPASVISVENQVTYFGLRNSTALLICGKAEAFSLNAIYITQYTTCCPSKRGLYKQWVNILISGLSNQQTATSCFTSPCSLIKSLSK